MAAQFKRIQSVSALPAVLGLAVVRREGERSHVSRLSYRPVATAGDQTLEARRPQRLEPPAASAAGGIGHVGSRVGRACARHRIGPWLSRPVRHS